jgi:hypothetical protein
MTNSYHIEIDYTDQFVPYGSIYIMSISYHMEVDIVKNLYHREVYNL